MSGNGDVTKVNYSAIGQTVTTDINGLGNSFRVFIPGNSGSLANTVGPTICSYYSTGKFVPGTKVRWEPSVSFTTTGRLYVGFTDNPEVIDRIIQAGTTLAFNNLVKGLGSVISYPVWQETDIAFPTKTRKKAFDVNTTVTVTDVNVLDRSAQTAMFVAIDGCPASISLGSFWYHDELMLEGIQPIAT